MIPIQLELTNFLSYRDTAVLTFNQIELACISGPNGAGKSSILDGITYALFGRSRSRSDDDVINRQAAITGEGAEVRFSFNLEGNIYRVIRRKQQRKGTMLELQIATEANQWKPLSESKIRETQVAIEQLLRMNYDTFTNASFLLQGKADEFTTKTPNKRKEILAELLGVTTWDRYKEAATEQRKIAEGQMALLDGRLADIDAELTQEEERSQALKVAEAERQVIVDKLKLQETILDQARQTAAVVERHKMMLANHQQSVTRIAKSLQNSRQTQQTRQQERAELEALLAQAAEIQAEYAVWQTVTTQVEAYQTQADEHNRLLQAKRPFELKLADQRSRLEQEKRSLQKQAERLATAEAQREQLTMLLDDSRSRLSQLQTKLEELAAKAESWHEARGKLQELEGEQRLLAKELNQLKGRAKVVAQLVAEKTAVQENMAAADTAVTQLTVQINAIAEQSQQHAVKQAELDSLKTQQPTLHAGMQKLKKRLDQLQATEGESACPLCGQALTDAHRTSVLAELKAEGKESGDRYRANKARIEQLDSEIKQLSQTLKSSDRLQRDQQTQQQRLAKAEARLAEIDTAVQEWENEGAQRLTELETTLADDTAVTAQRKTVKILETAVAERDKLDKEQGAWHKKAADAEASLNEIQRMQTEWNTNGAPRLAEIEQIFTNDEIEPAAQQALAELETAVKKLAYDRAAHQAAKTELNKRVDAPKRMQTLQQAEAALAPLVKSLADLEERIQEQENNLAEQQGQLDSLQGELATLEAGSRDVRVIEDEVFALREAEITAAQRVGVAQQRLAVLADRRQQAKTTLAEKEILALRIQRLTLLEEACGRNGVQALLIEHALPEIEDRANELLGRLTDGIMSVRFETQRQLKSRDAVTETLDISISDNDGERPYDNYSGGEQFRVNFAIRLALSQLLAKRSGARLQTLVIDEGFGSQDPSGRQRLVEAINTIKDDFKCILVITHIDELRDAFPTRIEVRKYGTGSQITVI
ncbi:MAG: SMC family ATPase [Anaerolineales bacterium]|nr:SMC family ATPase [Anaerolineales bacterium]